MAITRKFLKALGIEDDKAEQIIEEHTTTVERVTNEAKKYKDDAEKLDTVQKELDEIKGGEDYKAKYDTLLAQVEGEKAQRNREKAARAHLKEKGITDEASLDLAVLAASGEISKLEMDGEKIKDTKGLDALLTGTLSKLVTHTETEGTRTPNPAGTGGGTNYGDIYKKDDKGRYIMSTAERQKAIAEKMANDSE